MAYDANICENSLVQLPDRFGKYTLIERLAVGGMAEVFLARVDGAAGFSKAIALKRILPAVSSDREFINMFTDEARIAGGLRHPHIGQVHEFGEVDGVHFLAMEYIAGKDLLQILDRCNELGKLIPFEMSCSILLDICEALDYAHHKCDPYGKPLGIVHRDCSPQNIFVSLEGEVKLIDFGIAKAKKRVARTVNGVLKGKVRYMSPEQVQGDPIVDRRSDVFVLGSVFYEMVTGTAAFGGVSDYGTMEAVRKANFVPALDRNPTMPAPIGRIIAKAMAASRADRYQSCSEMRADLSAFLMSQSKPTTHAGLADFTRELFPMARDRESKRMLAVKNTTAVGGGSQEIHLAPSPQVPLVRPTSAPIEDMSAFASTYNTGVFPEDLPSKSRASSVPRGPMAVGATEKIQREVSDFPEPKKVGYSVMRGIAGGLILGAAYIAWFELIG